MSQRIGIGLLKGSTDSKKTVAPSVEEVFQGPAVWVVAEEDCQEGKEIFSC